MSTYSIDDDKRIKSVGLLIAFSVIIYYCIDYYFISPNKPEGTLFDIIFFLLPTSSLLIAWCLTFVFTPAILFFCKIENSSGEYEGFLETSWKGTEEKIPITMTIKQTLFQMEITLKTNTSRSINNTAHVGSGEECEIIYTYINDGSLKNPDIKIHRGTSIMTVFNGKIEGRYYNDPRDRETYGSYELMKT